MKKVNKVPLLQWDHHLPQYQNPSVRAFFTEFLKKNDDFLETKIFKSQIHKTLKSPQNTQITTKQITENN